METFRDTRKATGRFDVTTRQEAGRLLCGRHHYHWEGPQRPGGLGWVDVLSPDCT